MSLAFFPRLRRHAGTGLKGATGLLAALALSGCISTALVPSEETAAPPAPSEAVQATSQFGKGPVKVALILPLTGAGQGSAAALSMRNAAELALAEFQKSDLTILVKDDRGTAEGAREATSQALADGAELIIGPLFAPSVQATGQVARQAGRPVIAFSTDAAVASNGVYLLSFLAQGEVERVVAYAKEKGRQSIAALIPETSYGGVVEAQFRESAARHGIRVAAIERYPAGQPGAAVAALAPSITGASPQADALFIPDGADGLVAVGDALGKAGFKPGQVKPLGTGLWNDPRALKVAAIQGGWFAAPDATGFNAFAGRYKARYGAEPTRIATLSYDAVSLVAALTQQYGSQRFAEATLTNPSGFAGIDGVFRFRTDGTSDRALAIMEVRNGTSSAVSPAPKALPNSGT